MDNSEIMEFDQVIKWYNFGKMESLIEQNWTGNRSDFNGRLASYSKLLATHFSPDCLSLVISIFGEIGNNCFDHNMGYWQDIPGCLFLRTSKYCIIADRGRGIRASLAKVLNPQQQLENFLELAYTQVITGRAPEKRGNGLKFVKKSCSQCKINLITLTQGQIYTIGVRNVELEKILLANVNPGVLTLLWWS